MLEFVRRNRVLLTSGFFLLLLARACSSVNARRRAPHRPARRASSSRSWRPLQRVTTQRRRASAASGDGYVSLVGVERENEQLREPAPRASRTSDQHDAEIELENRRLSRLLDFRTDVPSQAVTARGDRPRRLGGWFESLTLNKGERDGIRPGMAVVLRRTASSGGSRRRARTASRVLLLTDHNSGVDAIVQRTRARGIVRARSSRAASLKYVKRGDDVRGRRPRRHLGARRHLSRRASSIGRVTRVSRKDRGLFQVAEVTPGGRSRGSRKSRAGRRRRAGRTKRSDASPAPAPRRTAGSRDCRRRRRSCTPSADAARRRRTPASRGRRARPCGRIRRSRQCSRLVMRRRRSSAFCCRPRSSTSLTAGPAIPDLVARPLRLPRAAPAHRRRRDRRVPARLPARQLLGQRRRAERFRHDAVFTLVYLISRRLWMDNAVSKMVMVFLASLLKGSRDRGRCSRSSCRRSASLLGGLARRLAAARRRSLRARAHAGRLRASSAGSNASLGAD